MSSHQFLVIMFFMFIGMLGLLYLVAILWDRFISQSKKVQRDRAEMDALGERKMVYENDYFNKLSNPSKLGENLPTRSCDNCGAGLDPDNKFCPICGQDISSWIGSS